MIAVLGLSRVEINFGRPLVPEVHATSYRMSVGVHAANHLVGVWLIHQLCCNHTANSANNCIPAALLASFVPHHHCPTGLGRSEVVTRGTYLTRRRCKIPAERLTRSVGQKCIVKIVSDTEDLRPSHGPRQEDALIKDGDAYVMLY